MSSPDIIYRDGPDGPPVVMLPGWATDGRVFALRGAIGARVLTGTFLPDRYMRPLADYLENAALGPVTLVGWSLGGFAAVEFARAYPRLVGRLVLVGVRRSYPAEEIAAFRDALLADRERCLGRFYRECFLPAHAGEYKGFREGLMRSYMAEMSMTDLLEGLEYLAAQEITPAALSRCPVTLIHGGRDPIAPPAEARDIVDSASAKLMMLPRAGHAAWLTDEFASVVADV